MVESVQLASLTFAGVALAVALLTLYFAHLREGKARTKIENLDWAEVSEDLQSAKVSFTTIFDNRCKGNWVITDISFHYAVLRPARQSRWFSQPRSPYEPGPSTMQFIFGPHQPNAANKSPFVVNAGETEVKEFEAEVPFHPLAIWITATPPPHGSYVSNQEELHPATQYIPQLILARPAPETRKEDSHLLAELPFER